MYGFKRFEAKFSALISAEAIEWCDAPDGEQELVDPRELIATQELVSAAHVDALVTIALSGAELPPIPVVQIRGELYVNDGHHRSAAALKRAERLPMLRFVQS